VFTIKHHPDGNVDRYKARLIARGFTQTYDMDYPELFSPVACLTPFVSYFSLVVNHQCPMFSVKNALLYGDLEEVYMEQPPEYVAQGENMMCNKAIYDLKQSPRAWP